MATEKKIAEGSICLREADKYLKVSMFKWKPDYDSAAHEYTKAATCFKTARALDQCKESLLKAADCYTKNHSFFSAAKQYEQAAMISKDMNDYTSVVQFVERAAQMFRENGTPDTAALALEKGAKMIENKFPDKAIDLYSRAAEVVMLEDRPRQAAEFAGKAARLLIKLKRYDEGAEMVEREMNYHLEAEGTAAAGRLVVALVLVHLVREDYVAADRAFKQGQSYVEKEETYTLHDLLQGYDEGDPELMARALNHPFIKNMDVVYAKLARDLHTSCLATSTTTEHKEKTQPPAAQEQVSIRDSSPARTVSQSEPKAEGATGEDSDDEYSGGLL